MIRRINKSSADLGFLDQYVRWATFRQTNEKEKEGIMDRKTGLIVALAVATLLAVPNMAGAQDGPGMSFFVTSSGPGDGANLGDLAGADAHCQMLAAAAGAGNRTWRAYLSRTQTGGRGGASPAVNARERIGSGPWYNANGQMIAASVADLHGDVQRDRNNVRKQSAVDENGDPINGVGDQPNQHDILTGSDSRGFALIGRADVTTCNNWTSNDAGNAMVGHHDRLGGGNVSWNAVHMSNGCSQENLVSTGGNGYFYCFAAD